MSRVHTMLCLALGALLMSSPVSVHGRTAEGYSRAGRSIATNATPAYCVAEHNVGRIALSVNNNGTIGTGYARSGTDCFTGEIVRSCEFPKGSSRTYLYAGMLWVGAVVGSDTLVSTGADGWAVYANEFHPEESPVGDMTARSTVDPASPEFLGAVSHQDYVAVYSDTCINCAGVSYDEVDNRPHRPLNIEVTQESYAWSYPHAEDFVLFDYGIRNIGSESLHEVYFGLFADADIHQLSVDGGNGAMDDITGFLSAADNSLAKPGCPDSIDLSLAWAADNDGDLSEPAFSTPHVTGVLLLDSPSDSMRVSYNWWISNMSANLDYGPQTRLGYRDFGHGGTGTPSGDRNKYFMLSNGEFDFDQVRVGEIGSGDSIWLPPNPNEAGEWADGLDTRFLLSFGPFDIEPGEDLPLVFAYVAGENFHTDPGNIDNLPSDPDAFYENVDFSDLVTNAVWAGWTYDNPGLDTDSDGDSGSVRICEGDTFWYQGDGVPDYRAAAGPDVPLTRVESRPGGLLVSWNGHASETTVDPFSQVQDFEGYHVYLSDGTGPSDFVRLASYDVEDYYRYFWNQELSDWDISRERFYAADLICAYAAGGCDSSSWHPLDFPREAPYFLPGGTDSVFYFEPIMANACRFGLETPIVRTYPEAPFPPYQSPEEVPQDSASVYLTDEGLFRYYEYQLLIEGLLPEVTYSVAVTAFDYGSFVVHTSVMETAIAPNAVEGTPFPDAAACCVGNVGSVASMPDCLDVDQTVDITDIQLIVDHLFMSLSALCCEAEGDVDLSGSIDIIDLQLLIENQFITLDPLPTCP